MTHPRRKRSCFLGTLRGARAGLPQHSATAEAMFTFNSGRASSPHRLSAAGFAALVVLLFSPLLCFVWYKWYIHFSGAEDDTDEEAALVLLAVLLAIVTSFCLLSSIRIAISFCRQNRDWRVIQQAPSTERRLEDGPTPAELSWRRRGWLVMLRARSRSTPSSSSKIRRRWRLTAASRSLLAMIEKRREPRHTAPDSGPIPRRGAISVYRVETRLGNDLLIPAGSTRAGSVEHLRQVVTAVVHVPEEGVFRNIAMYM